MWGMLSLADVYVSDSFIFVVLVQNLCSMLFSGYTKFKLLSAFSGEEMSVSGCIVSAQILVLLASPTVAFTGKIPPGLFLLLIILSHVSELVAFSLISLQCDLKHVASNPPSCHHPPFFFFRKRL